MNMVKRSIQATLGLWMFAATAPAFAAGTLAGQDINNTATVDYEVGTVPQTQVTSNTSTFKVDRKINLVVDDTGDVTVVPGSTDRVLTFTVTNNSNATLDFRLFATSLGSDGFDATNLRVRVSSTLAPDGYDAGDTADFLDELPPDTTWTVYVVGDIPSTPTAVNGESDNVTLTAVSAMEVDANGVYVPEVGTLSDDAVATPLAQADDQTKIETVFADVLHGADAARDGRDSDNDSYNVVTAAITLFKSSRVITDPINCTVEGDASSCGANVARAIPGAIVEYCLDVTNGGDSAADALVIIDPIPTFTTYFGTSLRVGVEDDDDAMDSPECDSASGTSEDNDDDGVGDAADYNEANAGAVTVRIPSVPADGRAKALFRVKID